MTDKTPYQCSFRSTTELHKAASLLHLVNICDVRWVRKQCKYVDISCIAKGVFITLLKMLADAFKSCKD